jgi:NADH-quinone oxidoreductase subunit G
MFIGLNLRLESPILNIKLRKNILRNDILYCNVGSVFNDNLNAISLGLNINNLLKYFQGKIKFCSFFLRKFKQDIKNISNIFLESNIMYLLGNSLINRIDNKAILQVITRYNNNNIIISSNYNNIAKRYLSLFYVNYIKNNLQLNFKKNNLNIASNILYLNLTTLLYEEFSLYRNINNISNLSKNDMIYLLGENVIKNTKFNFTIFQGHHINNLNVDLILPSVTFLEKSSSFLDIQGNVLRTNFILYPPIFARND